MLGSEEIYRKVFTSSSGLGVQFRVSLAGSDSGLGLGVTVGPRFQKSNFVTPFMIRQDGTEVGCQWSTFKFWSD